MSDGELRAIILAGGKGTRLRPYTVVLPKPLMPIGDYPILDVIIRQLVGHGFGRVTLTVNHQAEIIKAYFGDGAKLDARIDYTLERMPLSTMGPLTLIEDLPETFIVMNGDILTDLDYGAFLREHERSGALFTIAAHRREHRVDYGVLEASAGGHLTKMTEKPLQSFLVSMGVYAVSKSILKWIPPDTFFGFDHLMKALLENKEKVTVKESNCYWLDIGRPDDYAKAIDDFEAMKDKLLPSRAARTT